MLGAQTYIQTAIDSVKAFHMMTCHSSHLRGVHGVESMHGWSQAAHSHSPSEPEALSIDSTMPMQALKTISRCLEMLLAHQSQHGSAGCKMPQASLIQAYPGAETLDVPGTSASPIASLLNFLLPSGPTAFCL